MQNLQQLQAQKLYMSGAALLSISGMVLIALLSISRMVLIDLLSASSWDGANVLQQCLPF